MSRRKEIRSETEDLKNASPQYRANIAACGDE
jgi:hypothetical protein